MSAPHRITTERVRGYRPPWYTLRIYTCPDTGRPSIRLRETWHGGAPRGGLVCHDCGHVVDIPSGQTLAPLFGEHAR